MQAGRLQIAEQPAGRLCDLTDGRLEGGLISPRGLAVAADLADELQGGFTYLLIRHRMVKFPEGLDASAHTTPGSSLAHDFWSRTARA
jgi:hypothetical protein